MTIFDLEANQLEFNLLIVHKSSICNRELYHLSRNYFHFVMFVLSLWKNIMLCKNYTEVTPGDKCWVSAMYVPHDQCDA